LYQAQLCGANGTFYNSQTDVVKQNSQQNDEFGTAGQEGNPFVGVAPEGTILLASASEETRRPASAGAWRTYRPSRGGGPGPNARDEEEVYSPREAGMTYGTREAAITGPRSPAGAEATYFCWDHLGTVRMTAGENPTAENVERHDYEPYGLEMGPATNTSGNTHQFTGHERDALGGGTNAAMDYMHFRYYSPTAGRFMKPDNIPGNLANPQSWNMYSYVTGNPVNLNDPTGHIPGAGWLNDVVGGGDPWPSGGDSSKRQMLSGQTPQEDPPPPPKPTPPTPPPTPPTPSPDDSGSEGVSTDKKVEAALSVTAVAIDLAKHAEGTATTVGPAAGTLVSGLSGLAELHTIKENIFEVKGNGSGMSKEELKETLLHMGVSGTTCVVSALLGPETGGVTWYATLLSGTAFGTDAGKLINAYVEPSMVVQKAKSDAATFYQGMLRAVHVPH
jgi:RHS repeat-associated protein